MSSIATIVAFDGLATPVSHSLIPVSITRDKGKTTAEWREQVAGVPLIAQVRAQMSLERLKSGVYRTECTTVVPVMETASNQNAAGYTAQPKVAFENKLTTVGFFHERSDSISRQNARWLHKNIFGGNASSNALVATGPVAELIDQLISAT